MKILVTGGLGYIGSHACVALLESGYEIVVLDNLSHSKRTVAERIEQVAGCKFPVVIGDIEDKQCLRTLFEKYSVSAVFHFAGLKSPSESVAKPLDYHMCNVGGTMTLLKEMALHGVKTFVFSSSAAVYGLPSEVPVAESSPANNPLHPYGRSKSMVENILADLAAVDDEWRIACLRYFNPVGAHVSGLLGEDPQTIPTNLVPFVVQVASGRLEKLSVFGNDYDTIDGTGVRDYIHVQDLVDGHIAALKYLLGNYGLVTLNLGTGRGVSVLELIREFESTTGIVIPYDNAARRVGDVAECWANPALAEKTLNWKANRDLKQMCQDAWRWEQNCLEEKS